MLDELRQMAIFAKTVEQGSFRAAAGALRLSPSVVSHHVAQLEKRLGTALLYRTTRKLSLTPDGKRLFEAAQSMIAAAEAGLQDIADQTHHLTGILRVTVPAVFIRSQVTTLFGEFSLSYPEVQLSIDYSDARRELIGDGYDIAIRAGDLQDSSLKAKKLFEFQRRLVAAPSYLDSKPDPTSPDDLHEWDWLELGPVWFKKREFRNAKKRVSITKRTARISTNNSHALTQLTCAGAGVAIVPEFIAEPDISAGKLTYVLPDWTVEPIPIYAVWPANAPKDGLIGHFIRFMNNSENRQY